MISCFCCICFYLLPKYIPIIIIFIIIILQSTESNEAKHELGRLQQKIKAHSQGKWSRKGPSSDCASTMDM